MGSSAKTDVAAAASATPRVGTRLLLATNFKLLLSQLPNSKTNHPVKMAVSKIRQNYQEDCEALVNKQINMEFYASYVYLSMSSYFSRDDQALPGFASHFAKEAEEERGHGMKLMAYQSKRGGRCVFQDIAKPVGNLLKTADSHLPRKYIRSLWSGVPASRRWRLPLSWRRLLTRACSNSPSAPTPRETPISPTS